MDIDISNLSKDSSINKSLISDVLNDLMMYSIPPEVLLKFIKNVNWQKNITSLLDVTLFKSGFSYFLYKTGGYKWVWENRMSFMR